jgi:homoserine kinase
MSDLPDLAAGAISAFAPATVANVICGFDVFGFAVDAPGDEVVARARAEPGVAIASIAGDGGRLPRAAEQNTAGAAALALLAQLQPAFGVELELHKRMPMGSGLGSSAASAVAAVVAVNALCGAPFSREELLPFALAGEQVSCAPGAVHADNVAPSLLGGFVLIRGMHPLDVVPLPVPEALACALVHPAFEVLTAQARRVLPETIHLGAAVAQWGNVAGLVAALYRSDLALLSRSLHDVVVEPVRAPLIPGFEEVRVAALGEGALGCGISGACPTMFALCDGRATAQRAGHAMQAAFARHGIVSEVYVSGVNEQGAKVAAVAAADGSPSHIAG